MGLGSVRGPPAPAGTCALTCAPLGMWDGDFWWEIGQTMISGMTWTAHSKSLTRLMRPLGSLSNYSCNPSITAYGKASKSC